MGLILGSKVQLKKMPDLQIKASVKDADTDRYIFLRSRILTCDEPNGNGDFIPTEEVLKEITIDGRKIKAYETFRDTIVDYNHDTSFVLGKTIDAIYIEGKDGEKNSVDIICRVDRQAPKGLSYENKFLYDHIISRIDSTDLCEMSMEAFADNAECNFCGAKFPFAQPCEHIRDYMNATIKAADNSDFHVHRIDRDLRFVGSGIVENPADKNAEFKNLMAKKEEKKLSSEMLENISGLDLLKIVNALEDGEDRALGIADSIAARIAEPIYENEISKFVDKHLTAMEVRTIKQRLIQSGKMISAKFNAHLIKIEGKLTWLVMQNGLPIMKKAVKDIWGEQWDGEIDGLKISEYATSDAFKRNLLLAIQEKGIEYLEASWASEPDKLDNRTIEDVLKVRAESKDKWSKLWASLGGNFNTCASKMKGKVDDEAKYCSWLEHEASGKWPTEAKLTASEKDEFHSCVTKNATNQELKAAYGQTQQDAIEAYCFKSVFGIKASMTDSIADIVALNLEVKPEVIGGQKAFMIWAMYKQTGQWPALLASRLQIKIFANAISKLPFEEREVLIRSSELLKYGFTIDDVNKFHILASNKDIEKLQRYGMSTEQIRELFSKRFGV